MQEQNQNPWNLRCVRESCTKWIVTFEEQIEMKINRRGWFFWTKKYKLRGIVFAQPFHNRPLRPLRNQYLFAIS